MLRETHDLVTRAFKSRKKTREISRSDFFKASRQFCHISTGALIVNCYTRDLKRSIGEEKLKKLQQKPSKGPSKRTDISRVASAEGCSQRDLIDHSLPRQSINTMNSKRRLPLLLPGDCPGAPSVRSTSPIQEGLDFHFQHLDTVEAVSKRKNITVGIHTCRK